MDGAAAVPRASGSGVRRSVARFGGVLRPVLTRGSAPWNPAGRGARSAARAAPRSAVAPRLCAAHAAGDAMLIARPLFAQGSGQAGGDAGGLRALLRRVIGRASCAISSTSSASVRFVRWTRLSERRLLRLVCRQLGGCFHRLGRVGLGGVGCHAGSTSSAVLGAGFRGGYNAPGRLGGVFGGLLGPRIRPLNCHRPPASTSTGSGSSFRRGPIVPTFHRSPASGVPVSSPHRRRFEKPPPLQTPHRAG